MIIKAMLKKVLKFVFIMLIALILVMIDAQLCSKILVNYLNQDMADFVLVGTSAIIIACAVLISILMIEKEK